MGKEEEGVEAEEEAEEEEMKEEGEVPSSSGRGPRRGRAAWV